LPSVRIYVRQLVGSDADNQAVSVVELLDSILVTPSDHLGDVPQSRRGRNSWAWVMPQGMKPKIVSRLRNEQDHLLTLAWENRKVPKDWTMLTRMVGKVQASMMLGMASQRLRTEVILRQAVID